MSGEGAPRLDVRAEGARVAVIASSWHTVVMDGLLAGALRTCEHAGATAEVFRVPGSFELPLAAQAAARSKRFDAIVALGVIIRGGTPHFEYVSSATTDGLTRVSLDEAIPVGFGLLTCDDDAQAIDRAGLPGSREDKGTEAAEAALAMVALVNDLRRNAGA